MPPISKDKSAIADLEQSIARTVRPTPEAALRAQSWLTRHLRFGDDWGNGFAECEAVRVGGYCMVPGQIDEPRVVLEVFDDIVGCWDYDRIWRYSRNRVVGVVPVLTPALGEA